MNKQWKSIIGIAELCVLFIFASPAYAGTPVDFCNGDSGVATALGCVPFVPAGLLQNLLTISIGIGGGMALLAILYGGFRVMMSVGDPKRLQAGRETIEAAIIGLLLILSSVFILKLVGFQILAIPGFGS